MIDRALPIMDLFITGTISGIILITSFGIIPIIVALLNGLYIASKLKIHISKNHNGSIKRWLRYLIKKN